MEWMAVIGDSIQYIEEHITDDITTDNIAKAVNVSPFYFQKGFAMLIPSGNTSATEGSPLPQTTSLCRMTPFST